MAGPMRIRAGAAGGNTTVRVLMSHPMESGLRKDSAGAVIPAKYITDVEASHNGKPVLKAAWSASVSQNPFLSFTFAGGAKGDKIVVTWTDNTGEKRTDEAAIA